MCIIATFIIAIQERKFWGWNRSWYLQTGDYIHKYFEKNYVGYTTETRVQVGSVITSRSLAQRITLSYFLLVRLIHYSMIHNSQFAIMNLLKLRFAILISANWLQKNLLLWVLLFCSLLFWYVTYLPDKPVYLVFLVLKYMV